MRGEREIHLAMKAVLCAAVLIVSHAVCRGQDTAPSAAKASSVSAPGQDTQHGVDLQIEELRVALAQMAARMDQMQAHTDGLETELRATRSELSALNGNRLTPSVYPSDAGILLANVAGAAPNMENSQGIDEPRTTEEKRIAKVEEDEQLLESKVNDQYQTKVESASKYHVRLSGIALLNVFANRGGAEKIDVPTWARPLGPSESTAVFGATVQQSSIGLEVSGPELAGAKTRGEIQADFFGGGATVSNGITAGEVRMRTATVRLDWTDTSIVAGQDGLFFSPLSPQSFASVAEPALSYAGNLWAWTPQLRVEHRIHASNTAGVILQGGILDPLTGEPPANTFFRSPQAGERAGQPAYAARLAWTESIFGRTLTVGTGGYYSRQNWGFGRIVNGWAGTVDMSVPLGRWFTLSGEFYRGRAIGGLGGGLGRSVIYNGSLDSASTSVLGLDTLGGWGQIAFRPTERLEFNVAFGEDNPESDDFGRFRPTQSYISSSITRNGGGFANVIYYLRSNLILSLEYRRLKTFEVDDTRYNANQVNLGIAVLF